MNILYEFALHYLYIGSDGITLLIKRIPIIFAPIFF